MDAVFFDFDGVICDSVNIKTEAFASIYRKYGPEIEKKVIEFHLKNGGVSRYDKFTYLHKNLLNIDVNTKELKKLADRFSELVFHKVINSPYIEGALETLEKLKLKGIPTFIVTGTPEDEIIKILHHRNILDYFDEIHGSPKNKKSIINDVISRKNFRPGKCLFIGDAINDLEAALQNNINFLGIKHSHNKEIFQDDIFALTSVDISKFLKD